MNSLNNTTRKVPRKFSLEDLSGSVEYMQRARRSIPLGVSSSRRASQRPVPIVVSHAQGSRVFDIDGNEYIDYLAGWGPMILGHQPAPVIDAVRAQLSRGAHYAMPFEAELELAERVIRHVPSAEMATFLSTGSEAVHLAITIARGATGRRTILKFDGHFNGWISPVAINMTGTPPVGGQPPYELHPEAGRAVGDDVVICPWNDAEAFESMMGDVGDSLAAVIMEPIAINAGVLSPSPGYLERVRELCDAHGVVLIFDEVVTGFRLALGGAQERLGVTPDLSTFAKALGNGFPVSAVAGRREIMSTLSEGSVRSFGTYNANPLAITAANATLAELESGGVQLYGDLERRSATLAAGIETAALKHGVPLRVNRVGSVLAVLWGLDREPVVYRDTYASDSVALERLDEQLTLRGVLSSDGRKMFVSTAHSDDDIAQTLDRFDDALREVAK